MIPKIYLYFLLVLSLFLVVVSKASPDIAMQHGNHLNMAVFSYIVIAAFGAFVNVAMMIKNGPKKDPKKLYKGIVFLAVLITLMLALSAMNIPGDSSSVDKAALFFGSVALAMVIGMIAYRFKSKST